MDLFFLLKGKNPVISAAKSGLLGGSSGTTQATQTAAPVTDGSVTDGPVTEGSVTDGSVTDGPVTDGPITEGSNTNTDTTTTTTTTTSTKKDSGSDPCADGDGLYADVASGCQNYIHCVFSGMKRKFFK